MTKPYLLQAQNYLLGEGTLIGLESHPDENIRDLVADTIQKGKQSQILAGNTSLL